MATQLTQLASNLARVRERRRRCRGWLIVQPIDLEVDRRLLAHVEPGNEVADRLRPIRCAIVDGLRAGYAAVLPIRSVRSGLDRRTDSASVRPQDRTSTSDLNDIPGIPDLRLAPSRQPAAFA